MFVFGKADKMKYPFLDSVKEYIRDSELSIDVLGNDEVCKPIISTAYERIMAGINNKIINDSEYYSERDLQHRIFSFGIAMMILKLVNIPVFVRKFALSEARRSEKFLINDVREHPETVFALMRELFSIELKRDGHELLIPVSEYLKHSTQFNEKEWKLVNRRVDGGNVRLSIHEAIRLARRDMAALIVRRVRDAPAISLYTTDGNSRFRNIEPFIIKLRDYAKEFNFEPTESTDLPPCIVDAIKTLETGQNLSHSGRFMLASFLLTRGWLVEDVGLLFKNAPDYNPRVTNYQIGKINDVGYKCGGCAKLKTQGLCRQTKECGTIVHPLQFKKSR